MLNLYNLHIEELFLHQIGNKSKNEPLFLSDVAQELNDESNALLKQYFSKLKQSQNMPTSPLRYGMCRRRPKNRDNN